MTENVHTEVTGMLAMINAETGAIVEKGEQIGQIESMKVYFPLDAPASGKIVWRVDLGAVVGPDDVIAEIEEDTTT